MKSIYSFCFALCLLALIKPAQSQSSLLDAQVSFAERSAPIHFFLSGIESAAAITFSYGKAVPVQRTYHMTAEKRSIREHLDAMFKNDSLDFIERGRKILIVTCQPIFSSDQPATGGSIRNYCLGEALREPGCGDVE